MSPLGSPRRGRQKEHRQAYAHPRGTPSAMPTGPLKKKKQKSAGHRRQESQAQQRQAAELRRQDALQLLQAVHAPVRIGYYILVITY